MNSTDFINKITKGIILSSQKTDVFVVGISGLDASGKSTIAHEITQSLQEKLEKYTIFSISWDMFQFSREYKNDLREENWAIQHYKRTIDFKSMRETFFEKIKFWESIIHLEIVNYDKQTKESREIVIKYPLIVIVESIYLFRKELIPYIDLRIWLDITIETALKRAKNRERDRLLYGDDVWIEKKYREKNFEWYGYHLKNDDPKSYAQVVIDANDFGNYSLIN
jgi:uridine kinase